MSSLDLIIAPWPAMPDGTPAEFDAQTAQALKARVQALPQEKLASLARDHAAMIDALGASAAGDSMPELARQLLIGAIDYVHAGNDGKGFELSSFGPMHMLVANGPTGWRSEVQDASSSLALLGAAGVTAAPIEPWESATAFSHLGSFSTTPAPSFDEPGLSMI